MANDPRVERNSRSITALHDFLIEIINQPELFIQDEKIIRALRSQGSLSKLAIKDKNIYPSSLNTLKRISNRIIDGGFESLDRLRVTAQDGIIRYKIKIKRSNKSNKVGLLQRVKELEDELQLALQDLWHITMAFEKSLIQGRHYAEKANSLLILELCKREQNELRAILSLFKHPMSISNRKIRNEKN